MIYNNDLLCGKNHVHHFRNKSRSVWAEANVCHSTNEWSETESNEGASKSYAYIFPLIRKRRVLIIFIVHMKNDVVSFVRIATEKSSWKKGKWKQSGKKSIMKIGTKSHSLLLLFDGPLASTPPHAVQVNRRWESRRHTMEKHKKSHHGYQWTHIYIIHFSATPIQRSSCFSAEFFYFVKQCTFDSNNARFLFLFGRAHWSVAVRQTVTPTWQFDRPTQQT